MRAIVTGGVEFMGSPLVERPVANGADDDDDFDRFHPRATEDVNLAEAPRSPRCQRVELDIRDAAGGCAWVSLDRPGAIAHVTARPALHRRCWPVCRRQPGRGGLGDSPMTPITEGADLIVERYRSAAY